MRDPPRDAKPSGAGNGDAARPPSAGPVTVTVVVCAFSGARWPQTRRSVESVQPQLRSGDELVLVIDHNDDLLSRASAEAPGTPVIASTGVPGLSGARNTGVAVAHGEVVVFLDDDATARPGWLDGLRTVFEAREVAAAGTSVEPVWEGGTAPGWFPPEFGWVVGCGYQGLPTRRGLVRNPIGASMAIRRAVFDQVGAFCADLGRVGTLPVGCEETELCIRIARQLPGATIVHEPGAVVDHDVPVARQTPGYFLRRCFHEGRSKWTVTRLAGGGSGLAAERRYVRVVLPAGIASGVGRAVARGDAFALARAIMIAAGLAATVAGFALEGLRGTNAGTRIAPPG